MALLVCLIPTTIGGLLSAIGIAGMDRLLRKNVLAMSGRAVEAAGDVDTLLLDKTGTITLGNRMATELIPVPGVGLEELADAAQLASLADETPEGRSIVVLAKERYGLRGRDREGRGPPLHPLQRHDPHERLSTWATASSARARSTRWRGTSRGSAARSPEELRAVADRIGDSGGTPLAVSDGSRVLGIVHLKDVVKGGIKERFDRFRAMGIRTVMITGDNPRTAAAIAREAGVDDFLAEATPETKMRLIKDEQAKGKLVAMTGDGTNDAPALAQADVGVAMNTGTQAAKEAGNMVDLDSNPTKLLEVVEVGKQLLMTRGTLTTFSIANDVAKYFAILPAMFVAVFPEMAPLNVMRLASPFSAILSAVIFNAIIIIAAHPARAARRALPAARRGGAAAPIAARLRRRRRHRAVRRHQAHRPGARRRGRRLGGRHARAPASSPPRHHRHPRPHGPRLPARRHRRRPAALPAPGRREPRDRHLGARGRLGAHRPGLRGPGYFQPRPSAAGEKGYDPTSSGGSNLGPTSKKLRDQAAQLAERLAKENPDAPGPVPVELVTTSGSGLDPHLSPAGALWQVPRVARARQVSADRVRAVVQDHTEGRDLGFLGEPRVNVLLLNLALDRQFGAPPRKGESAAAGTP